MPRRLLTRDPTLVVLCFATWALFQGITLAGPGEAFVQGISYQVLARWPLSEDAWGWILLVDAGALFGTVFWGPKALRACVAVLSCGLWLLFGGALLAGGWLAGVFSAVGAYSALVGVGLGAATGQWGAGGSR